MSAQQAEDFKLKEKRKREREVFFYFILFKTILKNSGKINC